MRASISLLLLPLALAHNPLFRPHRHANAEQILQAIDEQQLALEAARLEAARALAAEAAYAARLAEGKLYERGQDYELDERGMPITATTTVMVQMTTTQTVWVRPTDQAHFDGVTTPHASTSTSLPAVSGSSSSVISSVVSPSSSHSSSSSSTDHASSTSTAHSSSALSSASSSSSLVPSSSHASSVESSASATHAVASASRTESVSSASQKSSVSASPSGTESASASMSSYSHLHASSAPASLSSSFAHSSSSSAHSSSSLVLSASSASSSSSASATHSSVAASSSSLLPSITSTSLLPSSSAHSSASMNSSASHSSSASSSLLSSHVSSATLSSSASTSTSRNGSSTASSTMAASSIASSSIASAIVASSTIASSSAASSTVASSTAASSAAASATPSLEPLPNKIMAGYFPDWSGWYLTPELVDFNRFDVIDFAFALPTASGGLQFTQSDSSDLLNRLVARAHQYGKHVKLSIGGWTGSAYFSTIFADSGLRTTFVNNIVAAYATYNLDGIDIDWEYPGGGGAWGNTASSDDSANYVIFLQQLRNALPSNALISLCTQVFPFAGPNNSGPLTDVSAFAAVIDYILIMNYDVWGSSDSTPGPNAPLSNACGNSTQPLASAYAAVASWTTAGMPADKITLGLPAYGYLQMSWATSLRQRKRDASLPPHKRGSSFDERATVTVTNDNGGTSDGQVGFRALVAQGALWRDGNGFFQGGGGFTREWDACSSTPWLKSWDSGQIVTYDDPQSLSLKAQFAAQAGLKGCNVWSIDNDYMNGNWYLTDAIRSGLGLS